MPQQRRAVSQTLLLDLLTRQLTTHLAPGRDVHLVDLGGGTGLVAVPLAELGYRVSVIDPSPDALASLARRCAERGVDDRVQGLQGDASDLRALVPAGSADAVLLHRVLEVVDDPAAALAAVFDVLRPGGLLSLLVSQGPALALAQGLAGQFAQARATATDPHRWRYDDVLSLADDAGLTIVATHGLGVVSDHVSESAIETRSGAYDELVELETALSVDPIFRPLAPQLHLLAQRPSVADGAHRTDQPSPSDRMQ